MARFEIYALGVTSITVNRSADLNSFTGRELEGLTITLNENNYETINLTDNDPDFDDDDRSQETRGVQTFDGQTYGNDTDIEAEYTLTLRDPGTGKEYQVLGLNLDRGQQIEGLVFVDEVPPTGVAFEVVSFDEGPGRRGVEDVPYSRLAVPCFTPGTLIETPDGPRAVEDLQVGDLVSTLDNGVQKLIWVGASAQRTLDLMRAPHLRPIEIKQHAFGGGATKPRYVGVSSA